MASKRNQYKVHVALKTTSVTLSQEVLGLGGPGAVEPVVLAWASDAGS